MFRRFFLSLSLLTIGAFSRAGYYTNQLRPHGHTTNTDGGIIANLRITGPSPWADVKAYGAKGNNSTDDKAAIVAAINAVSASGGGTVFFPAGNYVISSSITIPADVGLLGLGPKTSVLKFTSTTGNGVAPVLTADRFSIQKLKLYASNGSTGAGIYYEETADAMREIKIDDYEIEGFKTGMRLSYVINGIIGRGRFIGPGKATVGSIGLSVGNYPNNGIYGTIISKTYISSYESGYVGSQEAGVLLENVIVEGCYYPIKSTKGRLTINQPYFENNDSPGYTKPLIQSDTDTDGRNGITVINPFAWNNAWESNIESRITGYNISIIDSGYLSTYKIADDSTIRAKSFSTSTGNVGWVKLVKSHANTKTDTQTVDGESLGLISAVGINSSSSESTAADILFREVGAPGATYIQSEIVFKVGTNALVRTEGLVVRAPADGETAILLQRNHGGSLTTVRVQEGPADSGGAGFRLLRVTN